MLFNIVYLAQYENLTVINLFNDYSTALCEIGLYSNVSQSIPPDDHAQFIRVKH